MAQEEYYRRMLAPYIDDKPTPQQLADEEHRMHRMSKKYGSYKNQDWFKWDGKPVGES